MKKPSRFLLLLPMLAAVSLVQAEDGYDLWLRYAPLPSSQSLQSWSDSLGALQVFGTSDTLDAAEAELQRGLDGLLAHQAFTGTSPIWMGRIDALPASARMAPTLVSSVQPLNQEGFVIARLPSIDCQPWVITANTDIGVLYGTFTFLRMLQTGELESSAHATAATSILRSSQPVIQHRLLNHWDNLTRTVERVQSGQSIWEWFQLPDYVSPRYRDYARANASIGINGTVLTNVNSNALALTAEYLEKTAAIANVLRPYGIKVYLTARFSAPIEIGGLSTADPLDPTVAQWWQQKADEIYACIPDFGGFLVKANSEGQPGPQDYQRNHADGANMLADALAPHGGIVMWRAFVYTHENSDDRHKQAYSEFVPMDGLFRDNVVIQVKNGAIDFMPREPFHPMFGAMPKTPLALELQVTQEYLGGAIHLVFLAPLFEEVLDSDTYQNGPGTTVAAVVEGQFSEVKHSVIAGVANIGTDRNWTGHPLAQSNWYALGRLAWNTGIDSATIADEWIRQTFGPGATVLEVLKPMLLESREAVVNYSMPLGLHHIMAWGHHYGPGPWVNIGRADWTAPYYHRADEFGLGFDRTQSGSNALAQYSPTIRQQWSDPDIIPEKFLLWFHHIPWDHEMPGSHQTLWQELGNHYQAGVDSVRHWLQTWATLKDHIDTERYQHVAALLNRQEREAVEYKDACLTYFQTFSKQPWPKGVDPALYDLDSYQAIQRHHVPGDPSEQ